MYDQSVTCLGSKRGRYTPHSSKLHNLHNLHTITTNKYAQINSENNAQIDNAMYACMQH